MEFSIYLMNHRKALGLFLLTIAPIIGSGQFATPQDYSKMQVSSSAYWMDLDYVGDGQLGHKLDIHLPPEKRDSYPVVVCIYGSAWFSNASKGSVFSDGLGQALLENGFAVVSLNHRSSREAAFPAQLHDVRAALRFIYSNAAQFSLDTSFVGLTGWSSGGHLTSLTATTQGLDAYKLEGSSIDLDGGLGKYADSAYQVHAAVDWYGPTDFLVMDDCGSSFSHNAADSPESTLLGGPIQQHQTASRLADPATYVTGSTPAFLIIHGDNDQTVPYCQSEHLYRRLKETGVESRFITVEGGGHGPGVMIQPYFDAMVGFFKEHLNR